MENEGTNSAPEPINTSDLLTVNSKHRRSASFPDQLASSSTNTACVQNADTPKKYPNSPQTQKSFMEDGGMTYLPISTCYFPRPRKGESLTSFLTCSQLSTKFNGDLDRENAHFSISEAIISAIEQIKWQKQWNSQQQMTDTSSSVSDDIVEVDSRRGVPDGAESTIISAEDVALSLISKFKDTQLPCASELEWLVGEEDAPQDLLPLPPSGGCDLYAIPLRGTYDWAPPRPQVIFTLHLPARQKEAIQKQNYRCAGCGMRVAPQYASRFRYCCYLGRYFCTGCHLNQSNIIPARILQKWDFKTYPVCTFSHQLLGQMHQDPLFRPFDHITAQKVPKSITNTFKLRQILYCLKDFILTCRYCQSLESDIKQEKSHIFEEPEIFSLDDLINVRNGQMLKRLQHLVDTCIVHVLQCPLCYGRGFICEICKSDKVIFPWTINTVTKCRQCGACYHTKCWTSNENCVKCSRIQKRLHQRPQSSKVP